MDYSTKEFRSQRFGNEHPVNVLIPEPDEVPIKPFIGRDQEVTHCMAAWLNGEQQGALHFRLTGPPGVGKNELVYYLARDVERKPLYTIQGHEELTPEDIACTARLTAENRVEYVGSPLLAAMVTGGICFFDEIGKVPTRSLSLLTAVLDERRTLTSVLAGFSVRAHPEFRFCAAMNETDFVTYGLPGYLDDRLRPVIHLDFPPIEELALIVEETLESVTGVLLNRFRIWAKGRVRMSPREALNLVQFASRLHQQRSGGELTAFEADRLLTESAHCILKEGA